MPASFTSAAFTAAELTSLQQFPTAVAVLDDASTQLAYMIIFSDTTNRTTIDSAWSNYLNAVLNISKAEAYLLDVDPVTDGGTFANRAAAVALANTAVNAAITNLNTLHTNFTSLASVTGCGGGKCIIDCTAGITTAGSCGAGGVNTFRNFASNGATHTNTAITALTAFNQVLTYASPNSPWYPQVLGPHGDFDDAVFDMAQAVNETATGLQGTRQAWDWVTNGESAYSGPALYNASTPCDAVGGSELMGFCRLIVRMGGNIMLTMTSTIRIYGLIPDNQAADYPGLQREDAMSAVQLIAQQYEGLYSKQSGGNQSRTHQHPGIPYHYDNLGSDSWIPLTAAMTTRPVARALFFTAWHQLTMTAWRRSDGSGWNSFKFTGTDQNDATLQSLRTTESQTSTRGKLNDPNGPPVTALYP